MKSLFLFLICFLLSVNPRTDVHFQCGEKRLCHFLRHQFQIGRSVNQYFKPLFFIVHFTHLAPIITIFLNFREGEKWKQSGSFKVVLQETSFGWWRYQKSSALSRRKKIVQNCKEKDTRIFCPLSLDCAALSRWFLGCPKDGRERSRVCVGLILF